jgi:DNA-directed RNA polymerase subunit N (RpoN/RPB10)
MIIPVRCFTCGKVLADKYDYYKKKIDESLKNNNTITRVHIKNNDKKQNLFYDNNIENDVLNELKLTKLCCRRHMLTHRNIIDDM